MATSLLLEWVSVILLWINFYSILCTCIFPWIQCNLQEWHLASCWRHLTSFVRRWSQRETTLQEELWPKVVRIAIKARKAFAVLKHFVFSWYFFWRWERYCGCPANPSLEATASNRAWSTAVYLLIKQNGLGNSYDVIVCLRRKYASASVLERNVESAVESFVSGVERQQDGVIDVPEEIMKMIYNFFATMCYGRQ